MNRILLAIASAPLIVALGWISAPADATTRPAWVPDSITRACPTEDSSGPCYWDAKHRGNHRGDSFYVTRSQRVVYPLRECQYDVYEGELGVIAWPGAHITARVPGRLLHRTVKRGTRYVSFRVKRSYTQPDARVWADGRRCEGT